MMEDLTVCKHCGSWIDKKLGELDIAEAEGRKGDKLDPRAPGDWDDVCDVCNYGKGLT